MACPFRFPQPYEVPSSLGVCTHPVHSEVYQQALQSPAPRSPAVLSPTPCCLACAVSSPTMSPAILSPALHHLEAHAPLPQACCCMHPLPPHTALSLSLALAIPLVLSHLHTPAVTVPLAPSHMCAALMPPLACMGQHNILDHIVTCLYNRYSTIKNKTENQKTRRVHVKMKK